MPPNSNAEVLDANIPINIQEDAPNRKEGKRLTILSRTKKRSPHPLL